MDRRFRVVVVVEECAWRKVHSRDKDLRSRIFRRRNKTELPHIQRSLLSLDGLIISYRLNGFTEHKSIIIVFRWLQWVLREDAVRWHSFQPRLMDYTNQ